MNARGFSTKNVDGETSGIDCALLSNWLRFPRGLESMQAAIFPTSGLGRAVKEQIAKETGVLARNNVHGLDVFEDNPSVRIFNLSGTGTVHASPDPFLPMVAELHGVAASSSDRAKDVILLLNYALMRPSPWPRSSSLFQPSRCSAKANPGVTIRNASSSMERDRGEIVDRRHG